MNVCLIYNVSRGKRELVAAVEMRPEMSYDEIVGRWLASHGLTVNSRPSFECDMAPVIPHDSLMKFVPLQP